MFLLASLDGPLPVVDLIISAYLTAAFLHEVTAGREKEETTVIADAKAITDNRSAVYYGADIVGDATGEKKWRIQTGPMDYYTAVEWVYTTAASHVYGKGASWGLYTENQNDAAQMAISLGGVGPVLHEQGLNEYPHYHVNSMVLFGQYKHFHIWFGSIYAG